MTMKSPPADAEYPAYLLDRVTARIALYFDDGCGTFTEADCRAVARESLLSYAPVTGKELQLAAQMMTCAMASLDCLRCAALLPQEQVEPMLRMREDAVKLASMSSKAQRALEARQGERARGQAARPAAKAFDEAEFNALLAKVRDMVTYARARGEASRVVQDLDAAARSTSTARRKAERAWAEDLADVAAWAQQTQH